MKILQGVTGQAGQPNALASGLRDLGLDSSSCSIADHKFNYKADINFQLSNVASFSDNMNTIIDNVGGFDVFHFHARSFFINWPDLCFPSFHDIIILKLLGKRVFFHFRGQEIRLAESFKKNNPFHYVDDPIAGRLFKKMPDASKLLMMSFLEAICDGLFVVDEELKTYVPAAIVVPRVLAGDEWKDAGLSDRKVPVIVHAPSRRAVKGTEYVLAASRALKAEGVAHELRLVENMEHPEAVRLYREADIIVDQLRIGWYGVLATEAMALGKPVVSYIRDDLWTEHSNKLPICNASPITIKDRLKELICSLDLRRKYACNARAYFERTHSNEAVCGKLTQLYERSLAEPSVVSYANLLDSQFSPRLTDTMANKARSLSSHNRILRFLRVLKQVASNDGHMAALRFASHKIRRK